MAKTKVQKQESVKSLSDKLAKIKVVVFTSFDGLNVKATTELRNILREAKIDYTVTKKTLLKLALQQANLKGIDIDTLHGGLGAAFGYDDEIMPAKILSKFAKKNNALKLVGGIFQGKFVDAAEIKKLAALPGKEELYGKLVWLINYPLSGLVNVLAGNLRSLLYALNAIKDSKALNK
ncbi:MAG: 50S ribosomal protein L10 [Patescibacteria group bacterium]|jgi:large subunit ribosomal protein L10